MKMIHTCMRVLDLERSCDFYQRAFGLKEHARYPFESFTLLYMRDPESDFELELTSNHGQEEPYDLGNGYGHFALAVDDLEKAHTQAAQAGGQPTDIKSLDHGGSLLGRFFFVTDPDGYKIEVLAREGRFGAG